MQIKIKVFIIAIFLSFSAQSSWAIERVRKRTVLMIAKRSRVDISKKSLKFDLIKEAAVKSREAGEVEDFEESEDEGKAGVKLTLHLSKNSAEVGQNIAITGVLICNIDTVETIEGVIDYGDGLEYVLSSSDFQEAEGGLAFKNSHIYSAPGNYTTIVEINVNDLPMFVPGEIVLVTDDSTDSRKQIAKLLRKYDLSLIDSFDVSSLNQRVSRYETGKKVLDVVKGIESRKGILDVQPNFLFRTKSEPSAHLQKLNRILNFEKLHESYLGKGVKVAIIDTGVDSSHKDLKDRVASTANMLDKDDPYVSEIHGTAVAGIVGASLNKFGIAGVAPEVEIMAFRACSQLEEGRPEGICYSTAVAKALDKAMSKGARIINMSFGINSPDALISQIITKGAAKGVIFVAPVGNLPWQKKMTFPASHPYVLAVGGFNDEGKPYPNAEVASHSRIILAPAIDLFTTVPGNQHNFITGTSMASAAVTGILAVTLEKKGRIKFENIPDYEGDLCAWQSKLLGIDLCR